MTILKKWIVQLSPELRQEVQCSVVFLLDKKATRSKAKKKFELELKWRSVLRDLRENSYKNR